MKQIQTTLFFTILIFMYTSPYCQMIAGKVMSERGFNAAGISVKFKNKANAVETNADGSFKILASKLPDTLVFSAVGYEPYQVVVTDKTLSDPNFEIVLLEERAKLEDVVVTSRPVSKHREIAYSSASISMSPSAKLMHGSSSKVRDVGAEKSYAAGGIATPPVLARGYASSSSSADYAPGVMSSSVSISGSGRKIYSSDDFASKDTITRRSQLLSAGEINDFKKWKMWEDYNTNVFKSMSSKWNFYPTNRFSVQIQNNNHRALAGMKVYLVNTNTRDTVWTAITDNTGKAELWRGFNTPDSGSYIIATGSHEVVQSPVEFANGINQLQVKKDCNVSDKVQIAFVVDATGSMLDEIEYLKLELEDVIKKTFEKNNSIHLGVGSVFYRDKGDEYITKHINFQQDLLKVLNFIKLQRADGGGDYPEAVNAALSTAIDSMSWSDDARSKILFLFLDAPPHDEAAAEMFYLVKKAAAKGIRVVPIACSGTDKTTEFILRSMALATNGTYLFLTDHSGIGGSHIKPTTDAFEVETLNTLLQRTIEQMIFVQPCGAESRLEEPLKPFRNTDTVKIYPNPTKGRFILETKMQVNEMFVTDFTGKILQRINTNNTTNKYTIDISGYPSATYLVRYVTNDHQWNTAKVVLIH